MQQAACTEVGSTRLARRRGQHRRLDGEPEHLRGIEIDRPYRFLNRNGWLTYEQTTYKPFAGLLRG